MWRTKEVEETNKICNQCEIDKYCTLSGENCANFYYSLTKKNTGPKRCQ